mmetsp:Transcript_13875/g.39887  ORF Transcript_13875/g.39887 Transcript_13875/m.39887 type:complete len:255 (+) Transcript_13875:3704-4468(+)
MSACEVAPTVSSWPEAPDRTETDMASSPPYDDRRPADGAAAAELLLRFVTCLSNISTLDLALSSSLCNSDICLPITSTFLLLRSSSLREFDTWSLRSSSSSSWCLVRSSISFSRARLSSSKRSQRSHMLSTSSLADSMLACRRSVSRSLADSWSRASASCAVRLATSSESAASSSTFFSKSETLFFANSSSSRAFERSSNATVSSSLTLTKSRSDSVLSSRKDASASAFPLLFSCNSRSISSFARASSFLTISF